MIHAYDKVLLNTACHSLGRMLDFAEHSMHIGPKQMMNLFIASGAGPEFERGDIRIIAGMSGIELVYEVLDRSGIEYERRVQRHTTSLSGEYWCGYALAQLQWEQDLRFEEIVSSLDISDLPKLYQNRKTEFLHDLPWNMKEDEKLAALEGFSKDFVCSVSESFSSIEKRNDSMSKLKALRIKNGLSQSQLAKASGIPLRTIQQYEQRQKDINKARAEYLIMLSSALNCEPAALLQ